MPMPISIPISMPISITTPVPISYLANQELLKYPEIIYFYYIKDRQY